MKRKMHTFYHSILLATAFAWQPISAQQPSLHPQEPVSSHYKELQTWNAKPSAARAWMDTVVYPPAEYGSSVTFLLVKPHYLSPSQVETLSNGILPPANSSEQTRKELDYLLELQAQRTAAQKSRVEFLGNIGYWPQIDRVPSHPGFRQNLADLFFEGREIMGEACVAEQYPKTARLLKGIMHDMRIMEFTIKYKYIRPRPYHLEPALQPLARMGSPAFASGHTLWAFLQAYTWGELVPRKRNAFVQLAEEIRRSREIMGIHYPSDNEAARQLAYRMLSLYVNDKNFVKDLRAAQSEWTDTGVQTKAGE
jgi:acid phosphatase (class A)